MNWKQRLSFLPYPFCGVFSWSIERLERHPKTTSSTTNRCLFFSFVVYFYFCVCIRSSYRGMNESTHYNKFIVARCQESFRNNYSCRIYRQLYTLGKQIYSHFQNVCVCIGYCCIDSAALWQTQTHIERLSGAE